MNIRAAFAVSVIACVFSAHATVWYFDPEKGNDDNDGMSETSPFQHLSMKDAEKAQDGDELRLLKGVYKETLVVRRNGITVRGWGASREDVIIDGESVRRGIRSHTYGTTSATNCTVIGLTVRNAFSDENTTAYSSLGAGIAILAPGTTISNCMVLCCESAYKSGAGVVLMYEQNKIVDTIVSNCVSATDGGGVCIPFSSVKNIELRRVSLIGCSSCGNGGGASIVSDTTVADCHFGNNRAEAFGGGLYCQGYSKGTTYSIAPNRISNCTFEKNIGSSGGGIYSDKVITNCYSSCVFRGNRALTANGGGIAMDSGVSVVSMEDCVFEGNSASALGGAVSVSPKLFQRNKFVGNIAGKSGGALYFSGNGGRYMCWIEHCVFEKNMCTNETAFCYGGAAYDEFNSGSAAAGYRNCLFCGNVVSNGTGGAIGAKTKAVEAIAMENCTFADNRVVSNGNGDGNSLVGGGAIGIYWSPAVTATNCLFWGNLAPDGVQVNVQIGTKVTSKGVKFYNSLEQDIAGRVLTHGAQGNVVEADVEAVFEDYVHGGYQLGRRSVAIDKGENLDWMYDALDLRGKRRCLRINNKIVDIGCYEYWPAGGLMLLLR